MKSKSVNLGQFRRELRRLNRAIPKAINGAFREGALMLAGPLVQDAIAAGDPIPVDQGQYKAGWRMYAASDRFIVTNLTKQAVWIERGRGKGALPADAAEPGGVIYEWVRRKGIWREQLRSHVRAVREAMGPMQRASKKMSEAQRASLKAFRAQRKETAAAEGKKNAIQEAAFPIAASIRAHGFKPRWVLRRAVEDLRGKLPGMIRSHLGEIRA